MKGNTNEAVVTSFNAKFSLKCTRAARCENTNSFQKTFTADTQKPGFVRDRVNLFRHNGTF